MTSAKPELPDYLGNIRIILTRTSHPANIGSAARAMKTMGLHKLTIVAPEFDVHADDRATARFQPRKPARFPTAGGKFHPRFRRGRRIAQRRIAATLDEALADTTLACALTSRRREITAPLQTLRELVPELLQAAKRENKLPSSSATKPLA